MQGVENELTTKETKEPWQQWRTPKCPILREEHPIASLSVEAREGKPQASEETKAWLAFRDT